MTRTNKILLISMTAILLILVNIGIIFGIGALVGYLNTGADRGKMFHASVELKADYSPDVKWDLSQQYGEIIDKQTLGRIEEDYLSAWYARQFAFLSNSIDPVTDYYTEDALKEVEAIIKNNESNGVYVESTTLSHELTFDFLSIDGQLAVFRDDNVRVFKRVFREKGLISQSESVESYEIIMLLEDGIWRIRHLIRVDQHESLPAENKKSDLDKIADVKGINYYPQATPWDTFGEGFSTKILERDFQIIKEAGLNTIRVFIQYEDFGKNQLDQGKLNRLEELLDTAYSKNIGVILTLFDFYGDYSVMDWTRTQRHAHGIVSRFKDHPALMAWDLKNEPDLDFESRGKDNVINWLQMIAVKIKELDPENPITIGWSQAGAASNLADMVHFISFHHYKSPGTLSSDYTGLKVSHPEKVILLQEFGRSSYRGFWMPFGDDEEDQATYHRQMQQTITDLDIPYMSWTLYDFPKIPKEVVGRLPWRKRIQQRFGFIDLEGSKKKSFEYLATN